MSQIMDVIVIGCGASGLAALRKLHDAGLKVLGLEAADRIGGRIHTVEFANGLLDIGAAWCHGEKDNVVFELANPLGLLGRQNPDNKWTVMSNGELLANEIGDGIINELNEAVNKADKDNARSISDCVRAASNTNKTLKKDPQLTKSILEWFERNSHVSGQDDTSKGKSLKGLVEGWPCEGEQMLNWKGKGFKTILDILLNQYPDPSKKIPVQILLKKEVESIKWQSSRGDARNPLVQVKCKDGSLHSAKSVIVTLSVGVLQERHAQLFSPSLPAEKINTINNLQLAVLDKIYIEFANPWWPKSPANFTILWRDEDKAKFSESDQWITEIYGFLSVEHQPNVLLAWIYGNGAKAMEKVSEEGVKAGIIKLMDVVFKKQFPVSPVKSILRTKWHTNRFARGTYSYRSVAVEQKGGGSICLSEPLCHNDGFPVVCFAGEATSHHRFSAVNGAIEAGFREADRLIEYLKK